MARNKQTGPDAFGAFLDIVAMASRSRHFGVLSSAGEQARLDEVTGQISDYQKELAKIAIQRQSLDAREADLNTKIETQQIEEKAIRSRLGDEAINASVDDALESGQRTKFEVARENLQGARIKFRDTDAKVVGEIRNPELSASTPDNITWESPGSTKTFGQKSGLHTIVDVINLGAFEDAPLRNNDIENGFFVGVVVRSDSRNLLRIVQIGERIPTVQNAVN